MADSSYNTYVSPIGRFQAIQGNRLANEAQKLQNEQAPIRAGLMKAQSRGIELGNQDAERLMGQAEEQYKTTDIAARAYSLAQLDDQQMMQGIQQQMPDFATVAARNQATPDQVRQRLGAIAQHAAMKGYIQLPEAQRQPTSVQEYEYAKGQGYKGTFEDFSNAKRKAGATNISVDARQASQQNEFSKALGKIQADQFGGFQSSAQEAYAQIGTISELEDLLKAGTQTGPTAEMTLPLRRLAADLGLGSDAVQVANQEAFRTVANQMALRLRNPESGMGLTGNTSNRDLQFLKESVPGLGQTEAGNRLIIGLYKKAQNRKIETAKLAEDYVQEYGDLTGFSAYLSKWAKDNPLVTEADRARAEALKSEAPEAEKIPEGIDPADWEYLTPEERALFE